MLDDAKMKILSDFIRGKLANFVTCQTIPMERDEYGELAAELTQTEDGTYAAAIPWTKITELLQILIPILIGWFSAKEEE